MDRFTVEEARRTMETHGVSLVRGVYGLSRHYPHVACARTLMVLSRTGTKECASLTAIQVSDAAIACKVSPAYARGLEIGFESGRVPSQTPSDDFRNGCEDGAALHPLSVYFHNHSEA